MKDAFVSIVAINGLANNSILPIGTGSDHGKNTLTTPTYSYESHDTVCQ